MDAPEDAQQGAQQGTQQGTQQRPQTVRTRAADDIVIAILRRMRLGVLLAGGSILLAFIIVLDVIAPLSQALSDRDIVSSPTTTIALDIMPIKPGGPAQDYAAYLPTTVVTVSPNSVITVTIRNFDLDAIPLPAGSPYASVQGTIGGLAYADGTPYAALSPNDVAHTFTVPGLHISVPIPGHAASGKRYVVVTFSFRSGKAGAYSWRCMAPCGDGPDEQQGPMAEFGYMRGTLYVSR